MTSEGLGGMFEGDSADMYGGRFPLMFMGGRAEGPACADPGARTPIGMNRICWFLLTECNISYDMSVSCNLTYV